MFYFYSSDCTLYLLGILIAVLISKRVTQQENTSSGIILLPYRFLF